MAGQSVIFIMFVSGPHTKKGIVKYPRSHRNQTAEPWPVSSFQKIICKAESLVHSKPKYSISEHFSVTKLEWVLECWNMSTQRKHSPLNHPVFYYWNLVFSPSLEFSPRSQLKFVLVVIRGETKRLSHTVSCQYLHRLITLWSDNWVLSMVFRWSPQSLPPLSHANSCPFQLTSVGQKC